MSAKSDQAARKFFAAIAPTECWDFTDSPAKALTRAAFLLYETEWNCHFHNYDIRRWEWPFATLAAGGTFFGDEPWTILFRRAVEIASKRGL